MTTLLRRSATVVAVALTCALPSGSALAAPSVENVATATVQEDGGRAFDFAWDLSIERRLQTVDHQNRAVARSAGCTGCTSTAIAFQVVVHTGMPTPTVVVPVNVADGQNIACTECLAIAQARQFVRVYPQPARFTEAGRAVLADVRDQLRALETQNLTAGELHLAVETQEARVRQVLQDELVLKSAPDTEAGVLQSRMLQAADLS